MYQYTVTNVNMKETLPLSLSLTRVHMCVSMCMCVFVCITDCKVSEDLHFLKMSSVKYLYPTLNMIPCSPLATILVRSPLVQNPPKPSGILPGKVPGASEIDPGHYQNAPERRKR